MKISGKQLRRLIKEELGLGATKSGTGLPAPGDISKKLSSVGAEEAMDWLARVLKAVNFSAPAAKEEVETLPPEPAPVADEAV